MNCPNCDTEMGWNTATQYIDNPNYTDGDMFESISVKIKINYCFKCHNCICEED